MGQRERCRAALHRSRLALAERRYRVLQQQPARRMPDEEFFDSLAEAPRKLALSRYDDNNARPHFSLGNRSPAEARRVLEQSEGPAPGALAQPQTDHYQTQGLSSGTRDDRGAGQRQSHRSNHWNAIGPRDNREGHSVRRAARECHLLPADALRGGLVTCLGPAALYNPV